MYLTISTEYLTMYSRSHAIYGPNLGHGRQKQHPLLQPLNPHIPRFYFNCPIHQCQRNLMRYIFVDTEHCILSVHRFFVWIIIFQW